MDKDSCYQAAPRQMSENQWLSRILLEYRDEALLLAKLLEEWNICGVSSVNYKLYSIIFTSVLVQKNHVGGLGLELGPIHMCALLSFGYRLTHLETQESLEDNALQYLPGRLAAQLHRARGLDE